MTQEICRRDDCTGCSACASVCPVQCIAMTPDDEGFLRPVTDGAACTGCGKCREVCPVLTAAVDDGRAPACFASRIRDRELRARSSSGGLFTALSQQILAGKGVVIAAGFDEEKQVVHRSVSDPRELDELRRSKYVQSRIGAAYREAKAVLDAGNEVLFCGTPCQVAGLKTYLGADRPNLYTVDFICHGVPSPLAWSRYLAYQAERAGSAVDSVSFRSKKTGWKAFSMDLSFQNGADYTEPVSKDYYLRSFIMNMDLRPSCYHCRFKQLHRLSDITIADFWGVEKTIPDWDDDAGVSLALIHSEKGRRLFESCAVSLESRPISLEAAAASNPSLTRSVKKPPLREAFMRDLRVMRFDRLHRKYCSTGLVSKLRRKAAQFLKE